MLTAHYLATSQSDRFVWLSKELEVAEELKRYECDPVTWLAPPQYRALHPIGTAPVITDCDLVLGESAAIIDYIIHYDGNGRLSAASDDAGYPDYLLRFHFANGSFMPAAIMGMVAGTGPTGRPMWSKRGWATARSARVKTSPQRIS